MDNLQKSDILGRDISRPESSIELDGQTYSLAFDLNAFRIAEDVYEIKYRQPENFGEIMAKLASGRIGAVMAVLYGALVSGGHSMDWDEFVQKFRLTSIPGMKDLLVEALEKALPEVTETDKEDPR